MIALREMFANYKLNYNDEVGKNIYDFFPLSAEDPEMKTEKLHVSISI